MMMKTVNAESAFERTVVCKGVMKLKRAHYSLCHHYLKKVVTLDC